MTPADRAALREAAQRATPGPWDWENADEGGACRIWLRAADDSFVITPATCEHVMVSDANAAFIAAAHPAAVLDLLDALDTAERAERVLGAFDEADRLEAERDAALARVAELEAALRMARVGHDGYPDPCASTRELPCNCGAEEHNAAIDRALTPPAARP